MTDNQIEKALKLIVDSMGSESVTTNPEILKAYCQWNILEQDNYPLFAVTPKDTDELRFLTDIARKTGLNIVPVSSGPSHRKGGSFASGKAVVVDMSSMKKILRIDKRNKVALIEPGITFDELMVAAGKIGLRPLLPLLPRKSKSAIGSYIDREPVTIPKYHWDMTDPLLCIEAVLGTGDVFRTGSAAGPGTLEDQWKSGNAQKNPMGPAATDIEKIIQGAQGTMGLVSWGSVKLEKMPTIRDVNIIGFSNLQDAASTARDFCLRRLCEEILIMNRSALMSSLADILSLEESCFADIPDYVLVFVISGYEAYLPEERVAWQKRDCRKIIGNSGHKKLFSRELVGAVDKMLQKTSGDIYWKNMKKGFSKELFFLTTLNRIHIMEHTVKAAALEFKTDNEDIGIYIQPIQQGRSCHMEFFINCDPKQEREVEKASDLLQEAAFRLAHEGAFFSRPYEPWVEIAYGRCPDTVSALRKIKKIFDPDNVLNRGKLCFNGGEKNDS